MYVCLCNALSDKMVSRAVEAGAREEEHVYAHHGCEPVCGRCRPMIRAFLSGEEEQATRPAGLSAAKPFPMDTPPLAPAAAAE